MEGKNGQLSLGASRRTKVLAGHFMAPQQCLLGNNPCLNYEPSQGKLMFDTVLVRHILDGHGIEERDAIFKLMAGSELFQARVVNGKAFTVPDYNQTMEHQREMTMKRIFFLLRNNVFSGWLTNFEQERELKTAALFECISIFDHSLSIKLGVHFHLWGGAIRFLGTSRHHTKWLKLSEDYVVKGCFAMTELGHGSNVRGIETLTTYDPSTQEFVVNTPCESAQKYWIGGAANHATHTVVFSQLHINGKNQGVHAFIVQIRDELGTVCPGVRIADCGHKIGLNGVDNGRIWFDNVRVPRENLLNSVADVTPDGLYKSSISDPDQRFGAFMAPLTQGRVTIAVSAIYQSKIGLATAIQYALSRRAFAPTPTAPETLLLDYPSHQRRLLPLVAKTYVMSYAVVDLKMIYLRRTPADAKVIHVLSSGYKAITTWHNMRALQECREACGGQGLKSDNRIGQLKAEYDVQLTFEGDNNVLMQQVSKALLGDYLASVKKGKPLSGLGLEHVNGPCPIIPSQLDRSTLHDVGFQVALFHLRERDLLLRLANQVSTQMARGSTLADAFLLNYQLAESLGKAFSERALLETALKIEATQEVSSIKSILGMLRTLFVLTTVDEDPVFLRYGYLRSDQAQCIHLETSQICSDLRPHALGLVKAFGIPDSYLGPIAFDWIEYNSWSNVDKPQMSGALAKAKYAIETLV